MVYRFIRPSMIIFCSMITLVSSAADLTQPAPLTNTEWDKVQQYVGSLGKISFFPALLPVIMKNQDSLELTTDQKRTFRSWRKQNHQGMVDIGSQHLVHASGFKSAASEPTSVLRKDIHSGPATLTAAYAGEEDDCD